MGIRHPQCGSRQQHMDHDQHAILICPSAQAGFTQPCSIEEREMAHAADQPTAVVQQYIDGFNRGDAKAMDALCANPMSILDGMAPHIWHGPTATLDWHKDVLAEGEHL